jgi:outer membrane protein assembly factor BamA
MIFISRVTMSIKAIQGILNKWTFLILLSFLVFSCSPTRYVPEGEYLLNRNKVNLKNKDINKEELESYIRQKPNKRIVGFRFHLFLYNMSNIKKENGINRWLRSIGEEPVIIDSLQLQRSMGQLQRYLQNKGFYHASIEDSVSTGHKRAEVSFTIIPNEPYIINSVNYQFGDTSLKAFVLKDTINSMVKTGNLLDADVMQAERKRLESLLKNQGFYYFSMEYVLYVADTSVGNNQVNLLIKFKKYVTTSADNQLIETLHPRFKVNDVYVYSEYDPKHTSANRLATDKIFQTRQFDSIHFVFTGKPYIKPKIINQSIYIQRGQYYSQNDADKTYQHLSSLRVYKFVDVQFEEVDAPVGMANTDRYLNCNIKLAPLNKQSYTVEVEGTN